MQVLIIGASGHLGRHAYERFKNNGSILCGTFYSYQADPSMVHFDINTDDIDCINFSSQETEKCAIICAAETKIDVCETQKEKCFLTNVTSTMKVIDKLKKANYYIIFCSTECVYDGKKGNYKETDLADAVNEYGKMKVWIEQYLLENCPNACIFRIGRIVGDTEWSRDIFCDWKRKAQEKRDIYCIKDNYFSPVDVEDVVDCLEKACNKKICGIYNICGDEVYSRADLCNSFLQALGIKANVYERELSNFNFSAVRSLNTGMNNQKIIKALGHQFRNMKEVYERYKDI